MRPCAHRRVGSNSTECCLFFFECLYSFPKTFSNSTEYYPFFSEYESGVPLPSRTPDCVVLDSLCICIYFSTRVYIRVPVASSQYFTKQHGMLSFFLRVPVVFFKEGFKQHGMLPIFIRVKQHGMLPIFLRVRIHPEYDKTARNAVFFFSECLWSFSRKFSNSTECCPFLSE